MRYDAPSLVSKECAKRIAMDFSEIGSRVWMVALGTVAVFALLGLISLRRRRGNANERTLQLHRIARGVAADHLPNPPWYTGPPSFSPKARFGAPPPPQEGLLYQPPLPPPLHEAKAVTPAHGSPLREGASAGKKSTATSASQRSGNRQAALDAEAPGLTEPTVVVVADDLQRAFPNHLTFSPDTQPVNKVDYANYRYESLFPPADPNDAPLDDMLGDDVMRGDKPANS